MNDMTCIDLLSLESLELGKLALNGYVDDRLCSLIMRSGTN